MERGLPGSSAGKPVGTALVKTALRLVGGADLADAIADLTGLSRKRIKSLVRGAAKNLGETAPSEFHNLPSTSDRSPAEELLVTAFARAASGRRNVPVAALSGADHLVRLVVDDEVTTELAEWGEDEQAYFRGLARQVAELTCHWYLDDANARAHATAAAVGQGLRDHHDQAETLARIERGIDQIPDQINRPKRAGLRDTVIQASLQATAANEAVGRPIGEWMAGRADGLGVNASITVHDEDTLIPYITRSHDQQLRDALQVLTAPSAPSMLVLAVGNSCAGKTRTLYEAVLAVLPSWQLVAPADDTDLAQTLLGGVPARTVVWLDELQNKLTKLSDGITAAKAITAILDAAEAGPVVFAGTIWPNELQNLVQRPTPEEAEAGVAAIPQTLARAVSIVVPDTFSDRDLSNAPDDPRLQVAIATSTPSRQAAGHWLTQVLAGGTQLVNRLYSEPGTPGAFSPAARAVIHAAGDLRRVGMSNPLPRWALAGAAPGYLDEPAPPSSAWVDAGLDELTRAAAMDDPLTGIHTLDIRVEGVPALAPTRCTNAVGTLSDAYDLHDFLFQDHLTHHRRSHTAQALWETVTTQLTNPEAALKLADSADRRGLFRVATTLLEALAALEDSSDSAEHGRIWLEQLLFGRLCRGDDEALTSLRNLATEQGSTSAAYALALHLQRQAESGRAEAWEELRVRAAAGDPGANESLSLLLRSRAGGGIVAALDELRLLAETSHADGGVSAHRHTLVEVLADRARWDPMSGVELEELEEHWGSLEYAFDEAGALDEDDEIYIAYELADRARAGDTLALDELEDDDFVRATEVLEEFAAAELPFAREEIQRRAREGDGSARAVTAKWLAMQAGQGDQAALEALRERASSGNEDPSASGWLAEVLIVMLRNGADVHQELGSLEGGLARARYADYLELQAREGNRDAIDRLRSVNTSDADYALAGLLEARADDNHSALVDLVEMVNEGLAGAAGALIRVYQRRHRRDCVIELDHAAQPVLRDRQHQAGGARAADTRDATGQRWGE